MAKETKIEWCDSTLNLSMGCDGCELWNRAAGIAHCYAGTLTDRYAGTNKGFPESFEEPTTFFDRLEQALKWSDLTGVDRPDKPWLNGLPRLIFVGDMGDTFTETLWQDAEYVRQLQLAVLRMKESPHQFLFLTKRPKHLVEFSRRFPSGLPRNIWPGVTVTSQQAICRCDDLLSVFGGGPRFLSIEPLLKEVDLSDYFGSKWVGDWPDNGGDESYNEGIDWVIVGGESGHDARPMHPDWVKSIRDQCVSADVPFFFKQWGEWYPLHGTGIPTLDEEEEIEPYCWVQENGEYKDHRGEFFTSGCEPDRVMVRIGKKGAGRFLDGQEWNQIPEVVHA